MPAVAPYWPNPTGSHKAKVEWSMQVCLPGHKTEGRRVETRQKIIQRLEAKTRAVLGCGVNEEANSPFQLITRHTLARCHLQPFCQTLQGQLSHLKAFAHALPSAWNSIPSHLLSQLLPLLQVSAQRPFSEGFPNSWAQFKPTLDAATGPVCPQPQQTRPWHGLFGCELCAGRQAVSHSLPFPQPPLAQSAFSFSKHQAPTKYQALFNSGDSIKHD